MFSKPVALGRTLRLRGSLTTIRFEILGKWEYLLLHHPPPRGNYPVYRVWVFHGYSVSAAVEGVWLIRVCPGLRSPVCWSRCLTQPASQGPCDLRQTSSQPPAFPLVVTGDPDFRGVFRLNQVSWALEHELHLGCWAGGWSLSVSAFGPPSPSQHLPVTCSRRSPGMEAPVGSTQ